MEWVMVRLLCVKFKDKSLIVKWTACSVWLLTSTKERG